MSTRVLFVDLENVQKIDLSLVPLEARVMVFYGITQKKLPEGLVVQAQPLGSRLQWVRISGQGPNALDFHIAFYLGQEVAERPTSDCTILSADTGFDPLIRHVNSLGGTCRRVTSLKEAFPARVRANDSHFVRLVRLLEKEKARPTRRKGLTGKIRSWFPQLPEDARLALLQRLFEESLVRESGNLLTYAR